MRKTFFSHGCPGRHRPFFLAGTCTERCPSLPGSLTERIQQAQLIAEGKVLSQYSFWDEAHHNIYTSNLVKVFRYFKGELVGR
jgi:hypothetical protein